MSAAANPTDAGALNHIITSAEELTQRIGDWRAKGWHVLTPADQMTAFPPFYGVIATAMFIRTNPEAKECYSDGVLVPHSHKAFTRTGIKKIEQLAGISWLPTASRRTDDRRIQLLWEYESWCGLLGYDGQPRTQKGTAEVDLRDGSPQITGWNKADWLKLLETEKDYSKQKIGAWTEKRVMQARQYGLRLAESKSESAAVRAALGLKSSYTNEELKFPFVVLKVTYLPDYTDVDIKHMLADRASQSVATMFAGARNVTPFVRELPPASPSAAEEIDALTIPEREEEPVPVTATAGPTIPAAAAPPVPAPNAQPSSKPVTREQIKDAVDQSQQRANAPVPSTQPPPVMPGNAVYVEIYNQKDLQKKAGGTFTKAFIELSDGRSLVTVYGPFRDRLKAARDAKTPLIIKHKTSDFVPRGGEAELEVVSIDDIGAPQDVALPIDPPASVKL